MKTNKFFMGFAAFAALAMASCSSDEPVNTIPDIDADGDGVAYVAVSVRDADGVYGSRRGEDGDFEDAEADTNEGAVGSCYFYFFDENGVFVSEATAWGGASAENPVNDNINFKGINIVMLQGLQNKLYPKYVVTILNKPASFTVAPGSTLDDMESKLSMAANTEGMLNGGVRNGSNFIMATTSVPNQTIKECGHIENHTGEPLPKAFVTELVEANFIDDPTGVIGDDNVAKIYVERLAAKVTLNISVKDTGATGTELVKVGMANGKPVYKMKVTLAGATNSEDDSDHKASEFIYIQFENWGLNNTAKTSYMVKNFKPEWEGASAVAPFAGWTPSSNGATAENYHRCYWAKSWTYNNDTDANYNRLSESQLFGTASGTRVQNGFGKNLYCAENTHGGDFLSTGTNFNKYTTTVMLGARIYTSPNCTEEDILNLVRYNGVLYKESHYIQYELSALDKANQLNFYTKTDGTYTQVGPAQMQVVSDGSNGKMKLQTTLASSTELYMLNDDNTTYSLLTGGVAILNGQLTAFNASVPAYRHNGGLMRYDIPIEHFAEHVSADGENKYDEGEFGVVRNHHYVLTITMLKNLGSGVFDPSKGDEPIIPDDPDKELYQVGAQINILSWKVVNQGNIEL